MSDPEVKSRQSKNMRKRAATPESKARRSAAAQAKAHDPEFLKKLSSSIKEAHRKKRERGLPWKGSKLFIKEKECP